MAERKVAYPDHPDSVCDYCEHTGLVYAQNRAAIHVHKTPDGVWRQWPARPVK